ncbi:hypothetical protein Q1695_012685 [Nippostrongylus brasiliensis]|nr:hypothetical protein Q1695_012685 [Nippostrongylus brasiliensis]
MITGQSGGRQAVTIGDVDVEGEGISDCDKFNEPSTLRTSFPHRLSSSVGEVLHHAGGLDLEACEQDLLRPLTSCEGDTSRSFTYLEWVHENQARRMRSRSEWFLSPTIPSKASSHAEDVFALKAYPGSFSFTDDEQKNELSATADCIPLLPKKSFKIASRIEHLTLKARHPLLERTCSTTSQKGNFSFAVPTSGIPSSCSTRRRSWRVRSLKGNLLGLKTHSLDSPDTPLLPAQRVSNNKVMYSRPLAHSVGGETWLMEVISDDVCKKKRSLKKKH